MSVIVLWFDTTKITGYVDGDNIVNFIPFIGPTGYGTQIKYVKNSSTGIFDNNNIMSGVISFNASTGSTGSIYFPGINLDVTSTSMFLMYSNPSLTTPTNSPQVSLGLKNTNNLPYALFSNNYEVYTAPNDFQQPQYRPIISRFAPETFNTSNNSYILTETHFNDPNINNMSSFYQNQLGTTNSLSGGNGNITTSNNIITTSSATFRPTYSTFISDSDNNVMYSTDDGLTYTKFINISSYDLNYITTTLSSITQLWLTSSRLSDLGNNEDVVLWPSEVGSLSATTTDGKYPSNSTIYKLNGYNVVKFDLNKTLIVDNLSLDLSNFHIFLLYNPLGQTTRGPFIEFGSNATSNSGFYLNTDGNSAYYINNLGSSKSVNTGNLTSSLYTWQLIELVVKDPAYTTSNNVSIYINGVLNSTSTFNIPTGNVINSLYINGRNNTSTFSSNCGVISDLIIFNRALTNSERTNVEGLLLTKYNLFAQTVFTTTANILSSSDVFSTIVASGSGTNTLAYSTNNGNSWAGVTIFNTQGNAVTYNAGSGLWVAVGRTTNTIAYSSNGTTWVGLGTTIFTTSGNYIIYTNNYFLAVGSGTNTVAYSSNGTSWSGLGTSIFTTSGNYINYGNGIYVAVGTGTNSIAYSSDLTTWTGLGTTIFKNGYNVIYAQSKFTAIGAGSYNLAYSSDGITWTPVNVSIFSYIPTSSYFSIKTSDLSALTNGDSVTTWGIFSQATNLQKPIYNTSGSGLTNNAEHVSFSASSQQHLVSTSPMNLTFATTGFSAIVIMKFTGTPQAWERIFDFGNGAVNNNVLLARNGTANQVYLSFFNGGSEVFRVTVATGLSQDTWYVFSIIYNTNNTLKVYQNGVSIYSSGISALIDRTLTNNYIGRSNWNGDGYFNGSIAGLYIYNAVLSESQVQNITASNYDSTISSSITSIGYDGTNYLASGSVFMANSTNGINWTDLSSLTNITPKTVINSFTAINNVFYISLSDGRIFYTTCSNSNWEEISESLISKLLRSTRSS
jgi:hypothetical protein